MIYIIILGLIPSLTDGLTTINDFLYGFINGLAGRSFVFDNLVSLPLESNLVKAGLLGACFIFLWHEGADAAGTARRRRILLITLIASVFVIGATKTLSKTVFLPRPFIQSQKTFHLEQDRLVEGQPLEFRIPLDGENQKIFKALERGEIVQNDFGSFPSDHAGFYMTLALGIFLAHRSVGLLALGWTLSVTLGSRVLTGQHSPLDIVVGSAIAAAALFSLVFAAEKFGRRFIDSIITLTFRYSALASAVIFIFVFEATNTLENTRHVVKTARDIIKYLIGG